MRGALSLPSLFLGITPAQARQHLLPLMKAARSKYPRVVVPCAGRFTGPLIALKAGYPPDAIHASDVSLFSSLIGYLAAGTDVRQLGAVVALPDVPELETCANETADQLEHAAAVLLAMKVATTPGKNAYARMLRQDLVSDWRRHLEKLKSHLKLLSEQLKGIHYLCLPAQAAARPGQPVRRAHGGRQGNDCAGGSSCEARGRDEEVGAGGGYSITWSHSLSDGGNRESAPCGYGSGVDGSAECGVN
jgi:hypothetical protein